MSYNGSDKSRPTRLPSAIVDLSFGSPVSALIVGIKPIVSGGDGQRHEDRILEMVGE